MCPSPAQKKKKKLVQFSLYDVLEQNWLIVFFTKLIHFSLLGHWPQFLRKWSHCLKQMPGSATECFVGLFFSGIVAELMTKKVNQLSEIGKKWSVLFSYQHCSASNVFIEHW